MSVDGWPPPIGEADGLPRAAAALERFDADIRRVGAAVVAHVAADQPDFPVRRRIVTAAEIGAYCRDDRTAGCVVAVVDYLGRSGSTRVIGICLAWDGGRVYVPLMPGLEA